jgi:hypothetical protein
MAKLMLYIPTRGRVEHATTLRGTMRNLPKKWRERAIIVCPKDEVHAHKNNWPFTFVVAQPDPKMSIAQKRKWIFEIASEEGHDKIMMLDDDLSFCPRHTTLPSFKGFRESSGHEWGIAKESMPAIDALYKCSDNEDPKLDTMFNRIEWMLDKYRHGGIGPRLMSQIQSGEFMLNKRAIYALAYHVPTVMKTCELGRIEHREDLDLTLQLLRAGYENAVYFWVTVEQYDMFNASGGASEERTMTASNLDAKKLAKLHPGYVKTGYRNYKVSIPRIEVTVRWQLAAQHGQIEFLRWSKNS